MTQPNDAEMPFDGRPANESFGPSSGKSAGGDKVPTILKSGPSPANLFRCLQRRMVLAVGVGLVLATVGAAATWLFAPQPKHQVRTLISVPPPASEFMQTRERVPDHGSHQRNQVALVRSRLVLGSALKDPKVSNLPIIANMLEQVEWLEKEVFVDFSVAPEIMKISMRGMDTDALLVLVNAVREAYQREIGDTQSSSRAQRQLVLEELVRKYELQLKGARDVQQEDAHKAGGSGADFRSRLHVHLTAQLGHEDRDWLAAKSQLAAAKLKLEGLGTTEKNLDKEVIPEIAITETMAQQYKNVAAMKGEIGALGTKIADTLNRSAKGEKEPSVKRYREQVKKLQGDIEEVAKSVRPEIVKFLREARRQQVQHEIQVEKGKIDTCEAQAKHHGEEFKRLSDLIAKYERSGSKLDVYQAEISHLEGTLSRLKQELEAIRIEREAPSRVKMIEPATVAKVDPFARRFMMTAGAALGGFVFALFGIAWLEYRSRRVDSVDEVVLGLGMRLVGTVPAAKGRSAKSKAKGKDNPAQQVLTESVDAARTMLLHLARTHSLRTVMITSAVAGEGKTSLSCHLAASLARAGLRMLLIDGDMRNPTAHRLFGLPCDTGLCEVLTDKIEAEKAIKQTSLRGLYLMPGGHWTDQTSLAVSQGKPAMLFDQLRQQFDLIIVDSSPVLPVADGLMIGQQVDAVLLSVLCQVSRLTNLYAAWQRMEQLGVHPLGVVINGVSANLYGSTYSYPYPRKRRATKNPTEKGAR